jgi:putative phosphoribosyl transferase
VTLFADRADAGRKLAERLACEPMREDAVVYGIPRGGVVVAAEVARRLGLPLDVVVPAKVGAPGNPEYAIGAVAPDGEVVPNPESGFSAAQVARLAGPAREKIVRSIALFRPADGQIDPRGRQAIVVDDGLATGLTAIAACSFLCRSGAGRVMLAVPVASPSAIRALMPHVDTLIALETPHGFMAVGQFYRHFGQTSDAEVVALLGSSSD